jgi:carbon-monoxide dehydrogenase small subunit
VKRTFLLNGKRVSADAPPMMSLLRVLRESFGLTETRQGCEEGRCGACLVFLDGDLVNSCLIPFCRVEGARIDTLEGIRGRRDFQELERALEERAVFRCGFCAGGMMMAAYSLLQHARLPSPEAVRDALSGNLCRCGSYAGMEEVVLEVAEARRRRRRG